MLPLLRYRNTQRSEPRPSQSFISELATSAKNDPGTTCSATHISYAQPAEVKPMKRHFPWFAFRGPRGDELLQGVFLVRVDRRLLSFGIRRSRSSFSVLRSSAPGSRFPQNIRSTLRHHEGSVATELVPSGFRLRSRFTRAGRGGRKRSWSVSLEYYEPQRKSLLVALIWDLAGFAPPANGNFISKDARDGVVTGDSGDVQLHAD